MKYISTRGNSDGVSASQAILNGMVPGGGLYVPETIPKLSSDELQTHLNDTYQELAMWILPKYLTDFSLEEIQTVVAKAYNAESFDETSIVPLVKLEDGIYILELWHGPTAAFKDMALQLTPHLLALSAKKCDEKEKILVLVATSGDTGKAALEGFKGVEHTEIIAFYPDGGVSDIQALQMLTTGGNNTHVVAVKGNFDDCQQAVKDIFADEEYADKLHQLGYRLSSANSINWGRLLPQIVYYFSAYFDVCKRQQIAFGDPLDIAVPTGNFGNILAAYYAKEMGLPIGKLICASNKNNVLEDFFKTGRYNKNREFFKTNSPSMDILVSSNLERFLYLVTDQDTEQVKKWMRSLNEVGEFSISSELKEKIDTILSAGSAQDDEAEKIIADTFSESKYLLDTHTAVALNVVKQIRRNTPVVIDATANPYKFVQAVYRALYEDKEMDTLQQMQELEEKTGVEIHRSLKDLAYKVPRTPISVDVSKIRDTILELIE